MKKVIFITGATASGKSEIAIWLALKINGEIINADSRQVYKYLNIGSGKISEKEKKIVKHHLLDIAHPKRSYSLGKWLKDVDEVIKKIYRKNKIPIICGGTILYLKALKEGWVLPNVKPNYKLRKELEKFNVDELYEILLKLDPERAKTIQKENKRRLIRAIEIATFLGKVPSLKKEPKYEILVVAPYFDFKRLERKIYKRLIKRVKGIIQEIKKLRKLGLSLERIISFGLEYRWFGKYVKGEVDLKTAIEKCYKNIRRFAKKQINELKKLNYVYWFKNKKELLKIVKDFLKNENR
jgi:tRNA dimethylallyltransferase